MTKIANTSRSSVVLRDKTGEAFSIEPNDIADKDIDREDSVVAANIVAGNIVVGGTEKQARETARAGVAPGAVAASQPAA